MALDTSGMRVSILQSLGLLFGDNLVIWFFLQMLQFQLYQFVLKGTHAFFGSFIICMLSGYTIQFRNLNELLHTD